MSLLFTNADEKTFEIARIVYQKQFERDPKLEKEYDAQRKQSMYDDIIINLGYLNTAMQFNDNKIFTEYAVWIYHLLCSLMKDISKERIKEQLVTHFLILEETLKGFLSKDEFAIAVKMIANSISSIEQAFLSEESSSYVFTEKYIDFKERYLSRLLDTDTISAMRLMQEIIDLNIDLEEIYVGIIQEVMWQVGELWHQGKITVDKEHYCTSTTQTVLSQFYSTIFSSKRKGYKLVACCVGSELHEMGIRMISDLFEFHGWDSIYLGAGVPLNAVKNAIRENEPDLVGLSVTMPQHLPLCYEFVKAIRSEFPGLRIAIGGRAFLTTNKLWQNWDIDYYAENASQFVHWAKNNIES